MPDNLPTESPSVWVGEHKGLVYGGLAALVGLVVVFFYIRNKNAAADATSATTQQPLPYPAGYGSSAGSDYDSLEQSLANGFAGYQNALLGQSQQSAASITGLQSQLQQIQTSIGNLNSQTYVGGAGATGSGTSPAGVSNNSPSPVAPDGTGTIAGGYTAPPTVTVAQTGSAAQASVDNSINAANVGNPAAQFYPFPPSGGANALGINAAEAGAISREAALVGPSYTPPGTGGKPSYYYA